MPFAKVEVEVEYLKYDLDLSRNAFGANAHVRASRQPSTCRACTRTTWASSPWACRPGWLSIAALDIGTTKTYNGKTVSQNVVRWVQATDMQ